MGLLIPDLKTRISINPKDQLRLTAIIHSLEKDFGQSVFKLLDHEAQQAYKRMLRDAPYDTGLLRRNIELTRTPETFIFESKAIDPETGIDYAPDQDLPRGTLDVKTTPYFAKNIRRMIKDFERQVKGIFQGFMKKGHKFRLK